MFTWFHHVWRIGQGAIVIDRARTKQAKLAITLDAGGSTDMAEDVLEILKAARVRVTVFVTGRFAERYPAIVRRMAEDQHEIANHSYSHPHMAKLGDAAIADEITRGAAVLESLTGAKLPPYFRLPYGERSTRVYRIAAQLGFPYIAFWSTDTDDWRAELAPRAVLRRALRGVRPGAIILQHIGSPQTAAILAEEIQSIRSQGYQVATITDLLGLAR